METLTPTASGLHHKPATFETLTDALDYAAGGKTGVNFYGADRARYASLSYGELRDRSQAMASRLVARFERGAHVGLLAETSPDFLVAFMACQYAGLIAVPMSLPTAFGRRETYQWQIASISETASLVAVMVPDEYRTLLATIADPLGIAVLALDGSDLGDEMAEITPLGPDEPSYIQFSSGSTSDPKGVFASQTSVMANAHAITQEGLRITGSDRMVSWLPFYHDMGLVGFFIVPMCNQCSLDYMSPSTFARRPGLWLKVISENQGTITFSPSFGYGLAARRYRGEEYDLSTLRVAGIGGDMIEKDVLKTFTDVFAPSGFRETTLIASYGMAEVTLAASFAPLNRGTHYDAVQLEELHARSRAVPSADDTQKQRVFTACGFPLRSVTIDIRDGSGNAVGPREVGEIMLKGASLAEGYYRADKGLIPLRDKDGWFATGDLGYWLDGELVITGRSKDLMLWNGKNIWPQDLEWIALRVGGKQVSRAAAFDYQTEDGSTGIKLLVECGVQDEDTRAGIKREIVTAVRDVVGVPFEFDFVQTRSLPITSSGKLSRNGARLQYLSGGMAGPSGRSSVAGHSSNEFAASAGQ